jgi:predicted alpha/beta hydrolase family esterase
MRILFCHGKEGNPNGTKAKTIRKNFENVTTPRLTNSFDEGDFIRDLCEVEAMAKHADVLVGSSRGGALVAQTTANKRKVLIAPAWKKFCVVPHLTENDVIIHSKKDDLVPYEDSETLQRMFGCKLIECGDDHRMSCDKALETIMNAIKGA